MAIYQKVIGKVSLLHSINLRSIQNYLLLLFTVINSNIQLICYSLIYNLIVFLILKIILFLFYMVY